VTKAALRRYLTTIQGALYKATPPFGIYGSRLDALKELRKQLHVLNDNVDGTGPYLAVLCLASHALASRPCWKQAAGPLAVRTCSGTSAAMPIPLPGCSGAAARSRQQQGQGARVREGKRERRWLHAKRGPAKAR